MHSTYQVMRCTCVICSNATRTHHTSHSFPTRRSSDLGPRLNGLAPERDMAERVERALRQAALWDEVKDRLQDRKSTRLNSSHTVISYAVFCLKKKNIYVCRVFHSISHAG